MINTAEQALEGVPEKLEKISSRGCPQDQEGKEKLQRQPAYDNPQRNLLPIGAHQPGKPHHHEQSKYTDKLLFHYPWLPCATWLPELESAPAAASSSNCERSPSSAQLFE